jgi:Tfp pilus assembly protein PilF
MVPLFSFELADLSQSNANLMALGHTIMRYPAQFLILLATIALGACSPQPPPSLVIVETAMEERRFHDARRHLIDRRNYSGSSPRNSALLAQVMIELGDGYTAERYLNDVRENEREAGKWVAMHAHALILQGRASAAADLLDEFEGAPAEGGKHDWLRIWASMELGQNEEAQNLLAEALERFPQSPRLHAKAAQLAVWRQDWAAADNHIDKALAADPDNYEALLLAGQGRIASTDPEGALVYYRRAADAYPDFAIAPANVAGLLLDMGRLEEADVVLSSALERHPEFQLLRFNAARYWALSERWDKARAILQTMPLEFKRSMPATTLLEGEVEEALGNHAVARAVYETLADDPRFSEQVADLLQRLPAD